MSLLRKTVKIAVVDLILMNIVVTAGVIAAGHLIFYVYGNLPLWLGGN